MNVNLQCLAMITMMKWICALIAQKNFNPNKEIGMLDPDDIEHCSECEHLVDSADYSDDLGMCVKCVSRLMNGLEINKDDKQ